MSFDTPGSHAFGRSWDRLARPALTAALFQEDMQTLERSGRRLVLAVQARKHADIRTVCAAAGVCYTGIGRKRPHRIAKCESMIHNVIIGGVYLIRALLNYIELARTARPR